MTRTSPRTAYPLLVACTASLAFVAFVALVALGGAARADDGPAATPQRPSLSTNAFTVPRGLFELEAGAGFAEGSAALPLFGKYGLTDRLELEVGVDAVRWVDGPGSGEGETSVGDVLLGARWSPRFGRGGDGYGDGGRDPGAIRWAVSGLVKLPTADDGAGSGEVDATLIGIASIPLEGGVGLDLNLVWSALGRDPGGTSGQGQAIASLGFPLSDRWSGFVETAYQKTEGGGDGGFVDAGVGYAASPRAVLDVAAGAGWSDGYPDWTVTVGWTVLFAGRDPRSR